jgi:hypothetical protein
MCATHFHSFTGVIINIEPYPAYPVDEANENQLMITVQNGQGEIVNFITGPETYYVNHALLSIGDQITGFYDATAPVIMIYPPQYGALIIMKENRYYY